MADTMLSLRCGAGATIDSIVFSSYGTPSGVCPSWARGSCDAANSTSVLKAACLGQPSCQVWPNTTTFGDPCFGTAKTLAVALTCSSGSGEAQCGTTPAPAESNFSATVDVEWATVTARVAVEPSLQVVSHHYLWRDSPIYAQSWATLKQLGARNVRFVPWLP